MNKVLWAVRKRWPDWKEEVIIETGDADTLEAARKLAEKDGFDRFRVQELDDSPPDFVAAVKI